MALFSTAGLARGSARHPWLMILLWIVLIASAAVAQGGLGSALDGDDSFTNNPDAKRGADLIHDRMREADPVAETVIVRSETATVDDPAFRAEVEQTTATLLGFTDGVESATSYYDLVAAGDPSAEQLVSDDRHTTIIPVTLLTVDDELVAEPQEYVDLIETLGGDGFEVLSVGSVTADVTFGEIVSEDIVKGEMIGIPIAVIVLIVVFGALVAVGLPLLLALVSIFIAVGLAALVGQVLPLDDTVISLMTMIGLAVGIDYALFVVERYREERLRGLEKRDAIERAGASASKAVVFSGVTVIIALLGMFLIPVTVFQGLGIGAALVVIVAVLANLTLIPAMLSILGDKIDWPRRKRKDAAHQSAHDPAAIYRGFWGRITRVVMARPAISAILAIAVLVGAAWSATDLKTGEPGLHSLPDSDLKTAYEIVSTEFYAGVVDPVEIVIDGPANDPATQAGLTALVDALAQDPLYGPASIETNDAGDLTLVSVPMSLDAADPAAEIEIKHLREVTIPAVFDGIDAEVYVTGDAAFNRDFNTILDEYTPIVFAFVLGLSFLLLMVAFRSIVVPLKAILLNLLSVGAAYGLLVLVFQKGYGADLLGLQESPVVTAWIPIFLFCILFGLSMDYHVFLLSRIREHYDLTKRNRESVAFGLHATAKIITGAAVIMVAVFWGFASGRLVDMQQMGFGLAVAVLIDATIVRSVLVPASMALLGKWNWYLPKWLEWLPDLRVEGPADADLPEAAPGAASAGSGGGAGATTFPGHGFPAGHFGHAPTPGHSFHGSQTGHFGHLGPHGAPQTRPETAPSSVQADPTVAYASYPPREQPGTTFTEATPAPVTAANAKGHESQAAPRDENRFLKMISVPFEGRTYMSIAYLLLSLPLGIAYFTFLIVGLAVGLGSLMVVLGVPVLVLTISLAWKFMSLERHLAGSVLGQSIPAPFAEVDHQPSFWSRLKARLLHRSTYKGLAFLLAKLPIGIASFALTTFAVSVPIALGISLATFPFEDARVDFFGVEVNTIQEALAGTILAPLVILLALHILNGVAGFFARLARGAVGGTA